MIFEKEIEFIASRITDDPEKQKHLKNAIRDLAGQTWIQPDHMLSHCGPEALRGMLRRRRNAAESILNNFREAAGINTRGFKVDNDPIG